MPKPAEHSFRHVSHIEPHNSTPIIVTGDGLQVCLPLPKEVGDHKILIPMPSHKLYLCLWESGVYSPQ